MKKTPIKKLYDWISSSAGPVKEFFYPLTHWKAVMCGNRTLYDELRDIKDALFPISLSFSADQTIFNASDIEKKEGILTVRVLKNGTEISRDEIKEMSFNVSSTEGSILTVDDSGNIWNESIAKALVPFKFSDSGSYGYSSHTIKVQVILTSGKILTGSVIINEIATSWIGFIKTENPSSDIFKNENNIREVNNSTSVAGTYVFEQIPDDYCFWIITPAYSVYQDPVGMTNQFPITLTKFEDTYLINGVRYEFFRNSTGKLSSATWTIELSNKK